MNTLAVSYTSRDIDLVEHDQAISGYLFLTFALLIVTALIISYRKRHK